VTAVYRLYMRDHYLLRLQLPAFEPDEESDLADLWDRHAARMMREASVLGRWLTLLAMAQVHQRQHPQVTSLKMRLVSFADRFLKTVGKIEGSRATLYRKLGYAERLVLAFGHDGIAGMIGTPIANEAQLLRLLADLPQPEAEEVANVAVNGAGAKVATKLAKDYLSQEETEEEQEEEDETLSQDETEVETSPHESFHSFAKRIPFDFKIGQAVKLDGGHIVCMSEVEGTRGKGYYIPPAEPKADAGAEAGDGASGRSGASVDGGAGAVPSDDAHGNLGAASGGEEVAYRNVVTQRPGSDDGTILLVASPGQKPCEAVVGGRRVRLEVRDGGVAILRDLGPDTSRGYAVFEVDDSVERSPVEQRQQAHPRDRGRSLGRVDVQEMLFAVRHMRAELPAGNPKKLLVVLDYDAANGRVHFETAEPAPARSAWVELRDMPADRAPSFRAVMSVKGARSLFADVRQVDVELRVDVFPPEILPENLAESGLVEVATVEDVVVPLDGRRAGPGGPSSPGTVSRSVLAEPVVEQESTPAVVTVSGNDVTSAPSEPELVTVATVPEGESMPLAVEAEPTPPAIELEEMGAASAPANDTTAPAVEMEQTAAASVPGREPTPPAACGRGGRAMSKRKPKRMWRDYEVIEEAVFDGHLTSLTDDYISVTVDAINGKPTSHVGGMGAKTVLRGAPTTDDDLSALRVGDRVLVTTLTLHPPAFVAIRVTKSPQHQPLASLASPALAPRIELDLT